MADKWEWRSELGKAHLIQQDVADFLGIDKNNMSGLVKRMIIGEGKTATALDKERWNKALTYINTRQEVFKQEA